jgi:hypothetical protein
LYQGYNWYIGARPRVRFFARYRMLNTVIAALGSLLLVWLFNHVRHPDWNHARVEILAVEYFLLQMLLPLAVVGARAVRFNEAHAGSLLESKRKASLQPRGLPLRY